MTTCTACKGMADRIGFITYGTTMYAVAPMCERHADIIPWGLGGDGIGGRRIDMVRCHRCHRRTKDPVWFHRYDRLDETGMAMVLCAKCARSRLESHTRRQHHREAASHQADDVTI